ncbi:MAG: MFS transporter [Lachnospiraceae bacterium]|nr:MFS transporter [Lachnospiraceae bacterium]
MDKSQKKADRKFILSYAFSAGGGFQFIIALITSYFSVYLTDNLMISAGIVSIIMTVATLWDAINDPIMGSIADRTKSRFGRYRGYLLFTPFVVAILAVLLFMGNPGWTMAVKVAYISIIYILYGMASTVLMMPTYAILPAHTLDQKVRNKSIVGMMIVTAIGFNIVTVVGAMLIDRLAILVIIFALIGIIAFIALYKNAKEKYLMPIGDRSAAHDLKTVLKHKELYPVLATWFLANLGYGMMFSASTYYIIYYIGQPMILGLYMGILGIGSLLSMILMPLALKIFKTPKKTLICTQLITVILYIALFFAGSKGLGILITLSFIAALFSCMQNGIVNILLNDTIDYIMLKDRLSLNGIVSAIRSFASKCGAGLAMSVITAILAIAGYAPNAFEQSSSAMMGINMTRFGAPAIISIILIICMLFYPIEKHYGEIAKMKEKMADSSNKEGIK